MGDDARVGLQKVIADAMASGAFHMFSVMDAVSDPPGVMEGEVWLGALLAEADEVDYPMLHDEFYETYWDFEETRSEE